MRKAREWLLALVGGLYTSGAESCGYLRRLALIALLLGLAANAALAVNDKLSPGYLGNPGFSFRKLIMDVTLRADTTGAQGSGTRDSSWAYYVAEYDQLWLSITVKARNRSYVPYRVAVQVRDIACIDSAVAGNYLRGYAGSDTGQVLNPAPLLGKAVATFSDSFCVHPWNPGSMLTPHTSGTAAYSDSFVVGSLDTTRTLVGQRLLEGEFLVEFPPTTGFAGQGQFVSGWQTARFPLADARGVFYRGDYCQIRLRPLLVGSSNAAAATYRVMLSGYKRAK